MFAAEEIGMLEEWAPRKRCPHHEKVGGTC